MSDEGTRDVARQAANVVGAIFQVVAPLFTGAAIGAVSEENRSLITPADYAFVIWTPIFALAFAYAIYQALPSRRDDQLLRRIGWFSALAFFCNGLWELLFPAREFWLAQAVFFLILAGAGISHLRVQRSTSPYSFVERWIVAPAFGLLCGWVTAAILAGLATTLVATGITGSGVGAALIGAVLLVLGSVLTSAVVLYGRHGPVQGFVSYAGAVLWALIGVIANQYGYSFITTGTALICSVLLTLVVVGAVRRDR